MCSSPILFLYLSCNPAFSLFVPIFNILNSISGSGAPDYFAHHAEEAPSYVRAAQRLGFLMSPEAHEKHHKHPQMGYAYFSPVTNLILDNTPFWSIVKRYMEWQKGTKAIPVPIALIN
jgi:hypothetical protein